MTLSITRTSIQNFALYLYFFSINIENFNLYGYGSISFFSGLIYLLAILPSIKVMSSLNNNLRYFLPIMIYFVWLVINSLINVNWYSARVFDVAFFLNIVFFFAIVNHASKDKLVLEKALLVFAIGTIFTSMFMHGGWMHLIGNMLYLWIFADNIEDDLGTLNFVIFYFVSGVGAAMSQVFMDVNSQIPMIGASGAIGGVLGAYLINYPNARVLVLIPFGFFSQLIKIRSLYVLGFWFVLQFINSFLSSSSGGGVAYAAHIGGFITGIILILFFNKRNKKRTYKSKVKKINKGPWEQ